MPLVTVFSRRYLSMLWFASNALFAYCSKIRKTFYDLSCYSIRMLLIHNQCALALCDSAFRCPALHYICIHVLSIVDQLRLVSHTHTYAHLYTRKCSSFCLDYLALKYALNRLQLLMLLLLCCISTTNDYISITYAMHLHHQYTSCTLSYLLIWACMCCTEKQKKWFTLLRFECFYRPYCVHMPNINLQAHFIKCNSWSPS